MITTKLSPIQPLATASTRTIARPRRDLDAPILGNLTPEMFMAHWKERTWKALTLNAGAALAVGLLFIATATFASTDATAKPSTKQCMAKWKKGPHEKVLSCKARGGKRATNSMTGKRYIHPIGTCWDYDVVVRQQCGCRVFTKASICCWNKRGGGCPDFRVGSSKVVDCRKVGQPRYGKSGNTMNAACKELEKVKANREFCANRNHKAIALGSCRDAVSLTCSSSASLQKLLSGKCGPRIEDCAGCKLLKRCTKPKGLACYEAHIAKKAATAKGAKGPNPVKVQALVDKLNAALKAKDENAFKANWHSEGWSSNIVGRSGLAGKRYWSEANRKGWIIAVQLDQIRKTHGRGMPAQVTFQFKDAAGKDQDWYTALIIRDGGLKVLSVGRKASMVSALGLRWIEHTKKKNK